MGEEEHLAGMLWVERIEDEALQDPKEDELFRRLGEGSDQWTESRRWSLRCRAWRWQRCPQLFRS